MSRLFVRNNLGRVETFPVVFDHQYDLVLLALFNDDVDVARIGMLVDIVQCFLCNAIKVRLDFRGEPFSFDVARMELGRDPEMP